MGRRTTWILAGALGAAAVALAAAGVFGVGPMPVAAPTPPELAVVPKPAEVDAVRGEPFLLEPGARIVLDADPAAAGAVAERLAEMLRRATGFDLPIVRGSAEPGDIALVLAEGEAPEGHGDEGYRLRSEEAGVRVAAETAAGLANGVQTFRQLLPPAVSGGSSVSDPLEVVPVDIADYPRFAYRSAMLDVARHFFTIEEVERFIDEIAMLKINTLHLHLANDQGWRIEIADWPRLAEVGGITEVGGGPGGYYTQAEFRGLVAYAAERNVTIVPEANMPGHAHAALTAYTELTCDGVARQAHWGPAGGVSSLCPTSPDAEEMAADVIRELAALTPGPFLHLGGDEVSGYTEDEYTYFMELTASVAADEGKTVIGWHDIGASDGLPIGTVGQYWGPLEPDEGGEPRIRTLLDRAGAIVMSPPEAAYLDQTYPDDDRLGLDWAGPTSVSDAYDWDPADVFDGVGDEQILGIEGPLWTETAATSEDIEFLAFPRLGALAELGWSPAPTRDSPRSFDEFGPRLVAFLEHFDALGVAYHRSGDLPW